MNKLLKLFVVVFVIASTFAVSTGSAIAAGYVDSTYYRFSYSTSAEKTIAQKLAGLSHVGAAQLAARNAVGGAGKIDPPVSGTKIQVIIHANGSYNAGGHTGLLNYAGAAGGNYLEISGGTQTTNLVLRGYATELAYQTTKLYFSSKMELEKIPYWNPNNKLLYNTVGGEWYRQNISFLMNAYAHYAAYSILDFNDAMLLGQPFGKLTGGTIASLVKTHYASSSEAWTAAGDRWLPESLTQDHAQSPARWGTKQFWANLSVGYFLGKMGLWDGHRTSNLISYLKYASLKETTQPLRPFDTAFKLEYNLSYPSYLGKCWFDTAPGTLTRAYKDYWQF